MKTYFTIVAYSLLPVAAAIAGGIWALLRPPSGALRSALQHFAAGVVFSVAGVELLPDIMKRHLPLEVAIGFAAGVATMLGVKFLTQRLERGDRKAKGGTTLLLVVGIDIFIDGILIGVGFAAGAKEGLLLTAALTLELLSLGIALGISLQRGGLPNVKSISQLVLISLTLVVGALAGATLLRAVSPEIMELVLAFGLAALLYLVTEELLVEAHETTETPFATAVFFAGFLLFLILGMSE